LKNVHQFLGGNAPCPSLEESHILSYAKPALPQAGIYKDQMGDTESEYSCCLIT
jgi:hypothetical protein